MRRPTPGRRMAALALGAALVAACVIAPKNDGDGAGGAGGSAGSICSGKADCDACVSCARQQVCAAQISACQTNSSCVGLSECLLFCSGNLGCENECFANNPDGVRTHDAMTSCLYCEACPDDCVGYRACP